MWELDQKESWAQKNGYFWVVVLEKTLKSPLDSKEINAVNPKGNQPWIFIRRTDAEAEVPIFGPPDANNWLIEKDSDTGQGWERQKMRRLNGVNHSIDMILSKLQEMMKDREAWSASVYRVPKSLTQLSNWTKTRF